MCQILDKKHSHSRENRNPKISVLPQNLSKNSAQKPSGLLVSRLSKNPEKLLIKSVFIIFDRSILRTQIVNFSK